MPLRQSITLILILALGSISQAQDYDYVIPDSSKSRAERSGLQLPIRGSGQDAQYIMPSYMTEQQREENGEITENRDTLPRKGRTSVNLEVGSSVSSDFKGNTAISTYAAPHIRHEVDERLAISGGVIIGQTFFDGWKHYSVDGMMPSTVYTNAVYGKVEYRVDERLTVYGTAWQNIMTMSQPGTDVNQSSYGYSLGMQYKMSRNSFLQVEVQRSVGYNPFYMGGSRFGAGATPFSYYR